MKCARLASLPLLAVAWNVLPAIGQPAEPSDFTIYSAPLGETLSSDCKLAVGGRDCPVYAARVAPADKQRRWQAMDDKKNSAAFFDTAAFAYFDMRGPVECRVMCPDPVTSVRILPSSLKIAPVMSGNTITFTLKEPKHVTVEINGQWVRALHIFANPPEQNVPCRDDPNVIYFGPGIHEVGRLVVGDNQTVYIAGGAIVRAIIKPDEPFMIKPSSGLRGYLPTFELRGKNIILRGRGIIDQSACPTHARHPIFVTGSDIHIEGVIIRDASLWTVPIRQSDRVSVNNVKLIGYRANSDGIDICNSRDVTVDSCFIRTLDDLVVVKTDKGQSKAGHIVVKGCVLWNELAHALSIGAEIREDVDDVLFTNCDVIHDKGREWTLRVFHCDAARVSNIRFTDLRIEESRRLASAWIGKYVWSRDAERGHVRDVSFENIRAAGAPLSIELKGFDAGHTVEQVAFRDVLINGKPLTPADVKANEFVKDLRIENSPAALKAGASNQQAADGA